jgi:Holliday junction resolvase-like predicted endonuclease
VLSSKNYLGRLGEHLAQGFLESCGHKLILNNFRWKRFEIDLVSLSNSERPLLHLVEVKTRMSGFLDHQDLLATITGTKTKQLRIALRVLPAIISKLGQNEALRWQDVQVDLVGVGPISFNSTGSGSAKINYIPQLFLL